MAPVSGSCVSLSPCGSSCLYPENPSTASAYTCTQSKTPFSKHSDTPRALCETYLDDGGKSLVSGGGSFCVAERLRDLREPSCSASEEDGDDDGDDGLASAAMNRAIATSFSALPRSATSPAAVVLD